MPIDGDSIPLPTFAPERPLAEARADLRALLAEGEQATCACCGQTAKVYLRGLNATMIKSLDVIARSPYGLDNAAIIRRTSQAGGGNTSLMQWWGFVEQWHGKTWRATAKGRAFLRGEIEVPLRVALYDNRLLGFDAGEMVTVRDVAGRTFDLDEVLGAEAAQAAEVHA